MHLQHTFYIYMYTCIQDIREWLQEVITQLSNTSLNSSAKLVAAVVLMCCAHRVCISGIPDSMCLTLLPMMALQPDGADVVFLQSLMKNENMSRYVVCTTHVNILTLSFVTPVVIAGP